MKLSRSGIFSAKLTVPLNAHGWLPLVTRGGGGRVVNRFLVTSSPDAGQFVELASGGGARVRMFPMSPEPGHMLSLDGSGFPRRRGLGVSAPGITRRLRASRKGRFHVTLTLPAVLVTRSWPVVVSGRGVRLVFRARVAKPAPLGSPPASSGAPQISGTAKLGDMLSGSAGTWTGTAPIGYAFQWQRCDSQGAGCSNVPGATSASYQIADADTGGTLRLVVTATNSAGSASAASNPSGVVVGPPSNTSLPQISGTLQQGRTATATTGDWSGTGPVAYAFQWQRCNSQGAGCGNISGATSSSYALTSADVGSTLRVVVKATNSLGSASAASDPTSLVQAMPPSNTTLPAISGTAQQGQTLKVTSGGWSGTSPISFAYSWQRCNSAGGSCVAIAAATGSSYSLTSSDVGRTLRAAVTASNAGGSATAISNATAVVQPAPIQGGAVALWHMDSTSGGMIDSTGNGNNGTAHSITLDPSGFSGAGYLFNGSSSYVSVPDASDLNPGASNLTITIHVKPTSLPNPGDEDSDLIRKGTFDGSATEWKMEYYPSGQISCGFKGSNSYAELENGPALMLNQWHTVQCAKTSTAIKLVVDGQTFTESASVGSISNTDDILIGAHAQGSEEFNGSLDEASISIG